MKLSRSILLRSSLGVALAALIVWINPLNPPVARVGSYIIRRNEVKMRQKVLEFYYPKEKTLNALEFQKKSLKYAMILRNHGFDVSDEILRGEALRIEKNSKEPEKLAKIKQLFAGGHEDLYLRCFILPSFVESRLYFEVFMRDENVQKAGADQAQQLIDNLVGKSARHGDSGRPMGSDTNVNTTVSLEAFLQATKARGIETKHALLSLETGLDWDYFDEGKKGLRIFKEHERKRRLGKTKSSETFPESALAQQMYKNIFAPLAPGSIAPKPAKTSNSWLVFYYVGPVPAKPRSPGPKNPSNPQKGPTEFEIWIAQIPFPTFDSWLKNQ